MSASRLTSGQLATSPVAVLPEPPKTETGSVTLAATLIALLPPGVLMVTAEASGNVWLLTGVPPAFAVTVTVISPLASWVMATLSLAIGAAPLPPNT